MKIYISSCVNLPKLGYISILIFPKGFFSYKQIFRVNHLLTYFSTQSLLVVVITYYLSKILGN